MRLIRNGSMGILKDTQVVAIKDADQRPEIKCTCTNCLSEFAFRQTDIEVATTNELEFHVNCPVCDAPLEIGKHTGIVRQRTLEE